MPRGLIFNTQAKAATAQQKCFEFFAAKYANWLDANGAIVGENAATDLPEVRATRTTKWADPAQRADTGEWWIPCPPRFVLELYKTQLQNAGARIEEITDGWFTTTVPGG